jgi:crotonobetaine/carnitine-CoA ligase
MIHSKPAPGVISPFDGLDVPWLLKMRAEVRRDHPFLIWAPFDAPARKWSYGEFHERVGARSQRALPNAASSKVIMS